MNPFQLWKKSEQHFKAFFFDFVMAGDTATLKLVPVHVWDEIDKGAHFWTSIPVLMHTDFSAVIKEAGEKQREKKLLDKSAGEIRTSHYNVCAIIGNHYI